jgi:hypothetical protein
LTARNQIREEVPQILSNTTDDLTTARKVLLEAQRLDPEFFIQVNMEQNTLEFVK